MMPNYPSRSTVYLRPVNGQQTLQGRFACHQPRTGLSATHLFPTQADQFQKEASAYSSRDARPLRRLALL